DKPLLPTLGRGSLRWKIPVLEQEVLGEFRRRAPAYLSGSAPVSDWHLLALVQHLGMATRLLDWTSSPLPALWFTVEKQPPPHPKGHGVVWVFHVYNEDIVIGDASRSPFGGERTEVFQPPHIAKTITAQEGWFTVHKFLPEGGKEFVALEKN